ncbi:MAG: DUF6219 family protein [Lachnospiraceae bacterium]|nr:DUF6219 family protein [Lachnospiraceae bacterium]
MKAHRNWGIAALVFMLIAAFSGVCRPIRKSHALWGGLAVFCMIGAVVSGHQLLQPKKAGKEEEDCAGSAPEAEVQA